MRLADFIISQEEAILQEWENFARTMEPAALSMSTKELRNHAALMLRGIADDLRTPQSAEQELAKSHGQEPATSQVRAGEQHGIARLESHFSIEQLVSEYRALRASVLRLWARCAAVATATDIDDITRFNEAIDQLLAASVLSFAKASREAMEAEKRRKDEFLAMLAHELRNPLSPISAAASILKLAKDDQAVIQNASNIITRQVSHMATLVDDLLDVSRVTRGLIKIRLEFLDLRRVVDDALEQVAPQMQAKRHQLTVPQWPDPVPVRADRKRLVQVLTNLLTNAAKYTPEHGQIALTMEPDRETVSITVADNGIGMAPEFVPHVFDLFAQAERAADRASGGLGLGLALVKSLVGLHGGKVSCASDGLGKGSRFTVTLPLQAREDAQVERRRTPRTRLASSRPLKILVVDDNVDAAQMLSALLQAAGHHATTEHDPARALAVARADPPDVCLLDIGLPDMDGNELTRRLRAQPETSGMLIVALTGYCQAHDRDAATAAGFDHYMTKPVDLAKLQAVLASAPAS